MEEPDEREADMKMIKLAAVAMIFVCAVSCRGYAALPVLCDTVNAAADASMMYPEFGDTAYSAADLSTGDTHMIMDDGRRSLMKTFFEKREKGETLRLPPVKKVDWQEYLQMHEAELRVLQSA